MALLTAEEARVYLPELSGTAEDAKLATLISRAEAALAAYCKWPPSTVTGARTLEQATYTMYLDGPDLREERELRLPLRPIISVTSIHDDPDRVYGASTLVAADDYELDKRAGRVLLKPASTHAWSSSRRAIRVVAVCGLTTGSIPEWVKEACAWVVRERWNQRHTAGRTAITQGGQSQTIEEPLAVPKIARQLISPLVLWERTFSGAAEVTFG